MIKTLKIDSQVEKPKQVQVWIKLPPSQFDSMNSLDRYQRFQNYIHSQLSDSYKFHETRFLSLVLEDLISRY